MRRRTRSGASGIQIRKSGGADSIHLRKREIRPIRGTWKIRNGVRSGSQMHRGRLPPEMIENKRNSRSNRNLKKSFDYSENITMQDSGYVNSMVGYPVFGMEPFVEESSYCSADSFDMEMIREEMMEELSPAEQATFESMPVSRQEKLLREIMREEAMDDGSFQTSSIASQMGFAEPVFMQRQMPDQMQSRYDMSESSAQPTVHNYGETCSMTRLPVTTYDRRTISSGNVFDRRNGFEERHPGGSGHQSNRSNSGFAAFTNFVFRDKEVSSDTLKPRKKRRAARLKRQIRSEMAAQMAKERGREDFIRNDIREQEEAVTRSSKQVIYKAGQTITQRILPAAKEMVTSFIQGNAVKGSMLALPLLLIMLIASMFLPLVTTTVETAGSSIMGETIVEYARSWIGVTKYIYGGGRKSATDWQDYADCSAFVWGVFLHFGYDIGKSSTAMEDKGTLVGTNTLDGALPGDIVLFYTDGIAPAHTTHVGIYSENGDMVHCAGGKDNVSPETAGIGVIEGSVTGDGREFVVRRIVSDLPVDGGPAGMASAGHNGDPSVYGASEIEIIWAVVAQEDNGSYEGALAVISSAMNRTESPQWSYLGATAYQQLTAPGQYCYSMDTYWHARLNGNVPEYVKQAVDDCLNKGIRNHKFTSFRSTRGKVTGPDAVQIGGNWYFGS